MPRRRLSSNNNNLQQRSQKNVRINTVKLTLLNPVKSRPVIAWTFRFRPTALLNMIPIFNRCIQNLLWVADTANTGGQIISSFKIHHITLVALAPGGAGTELNTAAVIWSGGAFGKDNEMVIEGSASVPGVQSFYPPKQSSANFWNQPTATSAGDLLFTLNSLGAGISVDLHVLFVMTDGTSLFNLSCAGAVVKTVYTNFLDNSTNTGAAGTGIIKPVARFSLIANG